jgi:hypothetical protein
MCGNPQTADDAIIYKPVVPRPVELLLNTEKLSKTSVFLWNNSFGSG